MSVASHAISTGALVVTADTYIKSDVPTTNFGTLGTTGIQKQPGFTRRTLIGVTHGISGIVKVNSATIDLAGWNGADVLGYIYRLLRNLWMELEATWNEWENGSGWTTAGADDDGTDHTTVNGVSFTTDADGRKTVDISDIAQDCLDAGKSTIDLLLRLQDEVTAGNSTLWRSREYATEADRPTITINYTPEPYGTWLEADECVALPNALAGKIVVQLGSRTFGANDKLRVVYSTDPTMATGISYSTPVSLSPGAGQDGTWVNLAVGSLAANTRYYYRVQASDDGTTYPIEGDIRTFATQQAATSKVMFTLSADSHFADKWARRGQSTHLQASVDVDQLVSANIAAEVDDEGNPPSLHISVGDDAMYGVATTQLFPLKTDGSGDSDSPDSLTAKTATDCNEIVRAMRINREFPHHSIPWMEARSNHWPSHWFHYAANEPGNPDVAAWANAAMQNGLGMPAGALGVYRGQATYGAVDAGPVLVCMIDPLLDSYPTVTTPAPITMDSLDDWVLSTAQRDFFFHATTGELAITTKPWVLIVCHHLIGGRGAGGAIEYYGRGGINYVESVGSYWADTVHPALRSLKAANAAIQGIIVVMGHDHVHQFASLDKINYCHLGVPGDAPGGAEASVYGSGFSGPGTGNYLAQLSPNAGHYRLDATTSRFVLTYKRAYLADTGDPDPADGSITNGAGIKQLVLPDPGGPASPPPPAWMRRNTLQGRRGAVPHRR